MRTIPLRWIGWLAAAVVLAGVAWSFVPRAVNVETARAVRGPLTVTIDEDAKTRVRDRFTVSAPVAGYLERIALRPGAAVRAGDVVAAILPAPAAPLDARTRAGLEARVAAARDGESRARLQADAARIMVAQSARELQRQEQLQRDRVISTQELETARLRHQVADADAGTAAAAADAARHALDEARAALLAADRPAGRPIAVRAPRDGALLRVFEESERTVAAGTPLVEIGAPAALEIVAELLSTDAVRVRPGSEVLVERWGGDTPLHARVRLVEPSSFTKVSALGVEEQRVNVVMDFSDPPECWAQLGDRFAVEVRVVVWRSADAVKVPIGALFRRGDSWAVYRVEGGRAAEQAVRIEARSDREAAVAEGVRDGDEVIVHPSDKIATATRVVVR